LGTLLEGAVIDTAIGAPQGAVISPLLSNIYVHPLDLCWEREVRGTKMVRYAGDFVVLCRWWPAKIIKTRIVPAAEGPSLIPRAEQSVRCGGHDLGWRANTPSTAQTIQDRSAGLCPNGCIRLFNGDVLDLYGRVRLGTTVIVMR
jgi:hypothetical protein